MSKLCSGCNKKSSKYRIIDEEDGLCEKCKDKNTEQHDEAKKIYL